MLRDVGRCVPLGHTGGQSGTRPGTMPAVQQLTFVHLHGLTSAQKLLWLYIELAGEGSHSVRHLAHVLELSPVTVSKALRILQERGLIQVIQASRGRRAMTLRSVIPEDGC